MNKFIRPLYFCALVFIAITRAFAQTEVLAEKDGYTLTEQHFLKTVKVGEMLDGEMFLRDELIEEFNFDPQGTVELIDETYSDFFGGVEPNLAQLEKKATVDAAGGHARLREQLTALGLQQLPEQSFNTPGVNQLRTFFANSRLLIKSSDEYSSSKTVYTFCDGGTFQYYYGSATSIDSNDGDMLFSGTLEASATGVWDAYQEGGNEAVLIYSSDADFADQSLNNTGLLALPIAQVQEDLVQLGQRGQPATVDLLIRRSAISGCQ